MSYHSFVDVLVFHSLSLSRFGSTMNHVFSQVQKDRLRMRLSVKDQPMDPHQEPRKERVHDQTGMFEKQKRSNTLTPETS